VTDLAAVEALRANLWQHGYRPVAIETKGKRPVSKYWPNRARQSPPEAAYSAPTLDALNTGILCDGLRVIDVDVEDQEIATAIRTIAERQLGVTVMRCRWNSPRFALLYRATEGEPPKRTLSGEHGKVEILGRGQQVVAFGTHPSGAELNWAPCGPDDCPTSSLPVVSETRIDEFFRYAAPLIVASKSELSRAVNVTVGRPISKKGLGANLADVEAALAVIPNDDAPNWEFWVKIGMATWAATCGSGNGYEAFSAWSAKNEIHDEEACRERWEHWGKSPPGRIGAGSLFHLARATQPAWRKPSDDPRHDFADACILPPSPAPAIGASPAPHLSEQDLALRFLSQHHGRLRYVDAWGKWYVWNGKVWIPDNTREAFDLVREVCLVASNEADRRAAIGLASASTVSGVERLTRGYRALAATFDQWDQDAWLLNTPDGVLDLRSGRLRPHSAIDYMTKMTAVAPDGGKCRGWLEFLSRVTGGDAELQAYMQRIAGYVLTGSVSAQVLFFAYGTGANGKGVFFSTLTGILGIGSGGYAAVSPVEVFTASYGQRHLTELARLRGARLVVSQETEQNQAWAESRIKALTGGDPITANFMRQDHFTFNPQFKLLLSGNHKPAVRVVDEAIRRRIQIIPFAVTIPAEERDPDLAETLKAEWPGILAWMVEGCLLWQQKGLDPPHAVLDATATYLDAEDSLGQWLRECCELSPHLHGESSVLFGSWRQWAEQRNEPVGTIKAFAQALAARQFKPKRKPASGRSGFQGLDLLYHTSFGEGPPVVAQSPMVQPVPRLN